MNLDLGSIVSVGNDEPDLARMVAVMTQMQEGINALTDILVAQAGQIKTLEMEVRRLKARTDTPARKAIIHPGDATWRN